MRIGITAFYSNSGLGNQTWSLYRHLKPAKTLIADISSLDNKSIHPERFLDNQIGEVTIVKGYPQNYDFENFVKDLDVILVVETPLNHQLFRIARERNVKTALMYNYEFLDYFDPKYCNWPKPDYLLAPTQWHYQEMRFVARQWNCGIDYLPFPIDRSMLPFKLRTQARKFLHIAGHRAIQDRNGTEIVREAIRLVKNQDVTFTIRTQNPDIQGIADKRVYTVKEDIKDYWQLYNDEDVLLLPRRYGGLSIQRNEAMSLGMPVIMPNLSPNFYDLPHECLIQPRLEGLVPTRTPIGMYNITPQDLADKIDWLTGQDISDLSHHMDTVADDLDWVHWETKYKQKLEVIANGTV